MNRLIEFEISINQHKYKYYDSEKGSNSIIFLHGMAANKDVFKEVSQNFLSKYRCIILDLPAHHGVPLSGFASIHDIGVYVVKLINHLKLQSVILVGFSMGGVISLEVGNILKKEKTVRSVVAWSSPVLGVTSGTTIGALLGLLLLKQIPEHVTSYFCNHLKLQEFLTKMGMKLNNNELKAAAELSKIDRMRLVKMLDEWKFEDNDIPKLFIFDPHDPIIESDNYKELMKYESCSKNIILVPRGGHYGVQNSWNKSVSEIESFINSIGAEGGI